MALRILLSILLAAVGWLYWDARIPGLPLTSWQVDRFLDSAQPPHRIRRALGQLSGSHPALPALREYPDPAVRAVVARWTPSPSQLEDTSPWVRLNAALALVRDEPIAARSVLLASLRPVTLFASETGQMQWRLAEGARVDTNDELGTYNGVPLGALWPGRLLKRYAQTGETLKPGQRLADVALADSWQIAALEALGRIGLAVDSDALHVFESEKYPTAVQRAATAAIQHIQSRPRKNQ